MNGKIFLDTNILVYAHDSSTGAKHDRAASVMDDLWSSGAGVLSTQVLQEFAANLRRKVSPPLSAAETAQWIREYMEWEIVINTPDSVLAALDLEKRYRVSFWDALILQAAVSAGVRTLYTEDLSDGQTCGPVRVINPFK